MVGLDNTPPRSEESLRLQRLIPPLCSAYEDALEDLENGSGMAGPLELLCNGAPPPPSDGEINMQLDRAVQVLKEQL